MMTCWGKPHHFSQAMVERSTMAKSKNLKMEIVCVMANVLSSDYAITSLWHLKNLGDTPNPMHGSSSFFPSFIFLVSLYLREKQCNWSPTQSDNCESEDWVISVDCSSCTNRCLHKLQWSLIELWWSWRCRLHQSNALVLLLLIVVITYCHYMFLSWLSLIMFSSNS